MGKFFKRPVRARTYAPDNFDADMANIMRCSESMAQYMEWD